MMSSSSLLRLPWSKGKPLLSGNGVNPNCCLNRTCDDKPWEIVSCPFYSYKPIRLVVRDSNHSQLLVMLHHIISLTRFLGDESLSIDWALSNNRMEPLCRLLEPRITKLFQTRWLHMHECSACSTGVNVVDGNAEVRTKLCANTDDGIWNCNLLKADCLTGCQNPPMPGKKYCCVHLRDSDPVLGSDTLMLRVLSYLHPAAPQLTLQAQCVCCLVSQFADDYAKLCGLLCCMLTAVILWIFSRSSKSPARYLHYIMYHIISPCPDRIPLPI